MICTCHMCNWSFCEAASRQLATCNPSVTGPSPRRTGYSEKRSPTRSSLILPTPSTCILPLEFPSCPPVLALISWIRWRQHAFEGNQSACISRVPIRNCGFCRWTTTPTCLIYQPRYLSRYIIKDFALSSPISSTQS